MHAVPGPDRPEPRGTSILHAVECHVHHVERQGRGEDHHDALDGDGEQAHVAQTSAIGTNQEPGRSRYQRRIWPE